MASVSLTPTLHLELPHRLDRVTHTTWQGNGRAVHCDTARGQGRCACGQFRLCDPGRQRCSDDCPCGCHSPADGNDSARGARRLVDPPTPDQREGSY